MGTEARRSDEGERRADAAVRTGVTPRTMPTIAARPMPSSTRWSESMIDA